MMTKTLVLLSVSAGAGHVRAADALKAAVEHEYPHIRAVHIDVMDLVPEHFRKLYTESYLQLVKHHPSLWGYIYRFAEHQKSDSLVNQMRQAIERLNTRKLRKTLEEYEPEHVICTHFLPASLVSRMRGKGTFSPPAWVVDTDFDVHKMWVYEHIDGYFMADAEVAWRMRDYGVDPARIHVTGIPIMPVFAQQFDSSRCAAELGLDPEKKTLLMMSGGAGLGGIEELAERLLRLPHNVQIVMLAGKNETLLNTLQALARRYPDRAFPMGFTTTIERLMAASHMTITKPGGLTTSECLAMKLPMIVISPIPGQEERNADYLLEHGAAMKAYDVAGLEYRVKLLLEHPEMLDTMRHNIERIGRPHAARDILRRVLGSPEEEA